MSNINERDHNPNASLDPNEGRQHEEKQQENKENEGQAKPIEGTPSAVHTSSQPESGFGEDEPTGGNVGNISGSTEGRPVEREKGPARSGARGTAAMDPQTRKEVARKGGLAVSRNKQHMAEIGRKGGQSVSKNREHMAQIGRKGGAASRGHR
jgi:general stress protein YciG